MLGPDVAHAAPPTTRADRFGRMFELPPFADPGEPQLQAKLLALAAPDGPLNAHDPLDIENAAVRLIVDPTVNGNQPPDFPNRGSTAMTAGATFMGQFMDHDMTFDVESSLGVVRDPAVSRNAGGAFFDVSTVYGSFGAGGSTEMPQLYEGDGLHFRIENGGSFEDVPRATSGQAVIADPRNDENMVISGPAGGVPQVPQQRRGPPPGGWRLGPGSGIRHRAPAHRVALPMDRAARVPAAVHRPRSSGPDPRPEAPLPPPGGGLHPRRVPGSRLPFRAFDDPSLLQGEPRRQRGRQCVLRAHLRPDPERRAGSGRPPRRRPLTAAFHGMATFFDFGGTHSASVRPNKRIDRHLSTPLFDLIAGTIPGPEQAITVLPQRTLIRHVTWLLPSGQAIAREMGHPILARSDLSELREFDQRFDRSTPLFSYVLAEAELTEDGLRLGPVGAAIVGEVIVGLLQLDPIGFLAVDPGWTPMLPTRSGDVTGDFRMVDLLTFAGVDPDARGQ